MAELATCPGPTPTQFLVWLKIEQSRSLVEGAERLGCSERGYCRSNNVEQP